jgi:hypothetical protein
MNIVREKTTGALLVCGWLNAKNTFGGYVGYTAYFARLDQSFDRSVTLRLLRLSENLDHSMMVSIHCNSPSLSLPPR